MSRERIQPSDEASSRGVGCITMLPSRGLPDPELALELVLDALRREKDDVAAVAQEHGRPGKEAQP